MCPGPREVNLLAGYLEWITPSLHFNDWQTHSRHLKRNKQGRWTTRISLAPGRYQYRFLVDGEWCDDPRCSDRVDNPWGGQNCVRVVE